MPSPPLGLKTYFRSLWEKKHSIGSSPLTSSPSIIPKYLLFPIASLAVAPPLTFPLLSLFSLAPSCSWEMLQNLGSDHLPVLLTVPLSPIFRPNERLPSSNFQKARWDDFAFYFNCHYPPADEYSSYFLSFAAVLFSSLTLNVLLAIWCSGKTALFLFFLTKTALAYLLPALSVALRPPLIFNRPSMLKFFR